MNQHDFDDLRQRAQHSQAFGLGYMSIEASVLLELLADAARADSAETALDLAENEIQHKRGEIYDLEAAIDILKGDVEELEAEAKILCGVVEFPEEASGGL